MEEKKIESLPPQEQVAEPAPAEKNTAAEETVAEETAAEPAAQQALPEKAAEPKSDMRKKILILVLALLCVGGLVVLIVFRAGIPLVDFWTVAGSITPIETEIQSVEKIEGVSGHRVDSKGVLALYSAGDGKQTVVNLSEGEILASPEDGEELYHEITLYEAGGSAWYSVVTAAGTGAQMRYSIELCDESGECFAKQENMTYAAFSALSYTAVLDLVRLGQDVYRVEKNGTVRLAFTMDTFAKLPTFDSKVGDYYFVTEVGACYVYSKDAVLAATYHVPTGVEKSDIFILSDGTILAQYVTYEGENASDYTYAVKEDKYKLHHVLVSAKTGEQTHLKKPEFFITSVVSDDEELHRRGLNTGIANLVKGYYISDALLDVSDHALSGVLMSNSGRITSEVGDIIPAMYGGEIVGVAKNRWVAKNLAGERYLLNEWGAVVGSFPSDGAEIAMAASIFICEGKIYNWDIELLYDMWENGVENYRIVGSSVVMYKENGEVLLFDPEAEEAEVLLAQGEEKNVTVLGSALIAVEENAESGKQFALYNEHKELLITIDAQSIEARALDVDGKRTVELLVTAGGSVSLYLASVED